MNNEKILRQFDEIEQKVGKLIDVCKALEADNLELKNKVDKLERELQDRHETENNYQEERALIRTKIDNLLVRLGEMTEVQA